MSIAMKINSHNDSVLNGPPARPAQTQKPMVNLQKPVAADLAPGAQQQTQHQQAVERIDALTKLYRLLEHTSRSDLASQARRLQKYLQLPMPLQAALKLAQGDPARADILLQHSLMLAQLEGRQADMRTTRELLDALREQHGDKIRAGINTASAIALFSSDPQQRSALRNLYYQAIVGQEPLASLMEGLLARLGPKRFYRGLRTLQRALSEDIAALESSLPKAVLRSLLWNLSACGCLSSLLKDCKALHEGLHPIVPANVMTPLVMGKRILRFCTKGFTTPELEAFTEDALGQARHLRWRLLNRLYTLLLNLSPALWRDVKTRQSSLLLIRNLISEGRKTLRSGRRALRAGVEPL